MCVCMSGTEATEIAYRLMLRYINNLNGGPRGVEMCS